MSSCEGGEDERIVAYKVGRSARSVGKVAVKSAGDGKKYRRTSYTRVQGRPSATGKSAKTY